MRIDIHCHFLGNGARIADIGNDVYFNADDNQHWFTRILYNLLESDLASMETDLNRDGKISTNEYFELIYRLLASSEEIDGLVLLALDAVYSAKTGQLDEKATDLWVSNRCLSKKVKELNSRLEDNALGNKKFLLGASVNPNNKDWEAELRYVLDETDAVLLKLIPSTQHIDLSSPGHRAFYNALQSAEMPLLCHVGPEYSFPEGIRKRELDFFKKLAYPLECDVRVIAAHCATPVFPIIDRNHVREFSSFMESANSGGMRLWADTSALSLSTRTFFLKEIMDWIPSGWLVHGSDFPIPMDGWTHLPLLNRKISPEEYIRICKSKNPLDRDVRIKRAHGFSDLILERGEKILAIRNL